MRFKTMMIAVTMALMAVTSFACSLEELHGLHEQRKTDPISGEWDATFYNEGNTNSFTLKLRLKLEGNKVTGTYESEHVGGGNISHGEWTANKIGFSIEISHGSGSLGVTGSLKDGKLVGDFDAGQMKGKWEAVKK